jgi:hypothetical protein
VVAALRLGRGVKAGPAEMAGRGTQSECMAKAKSTKPRDLIRWRVSLITSTKFIDFTMAPDAETAGEQVAEAYDIGDELRHRLMAIRDDL